MIKSLLLVFFSFLWMTIPSHAGSPVAGADDKSAKGVMSIEDSAWSTTILGGGE
jgi:hypothetical protein